MALRVHDTLSGEKADFVPHEEGRVKMYVCGVTPYDRSHLGHARCYVTYDLIYRHLLASGFEVTYVRNFTDVDDKIIARAQQLGIEPLDLAQQNIALFHNDMDALGVARPDLEPTVSGTIPEIITFIEGLIARDIAYESEGDVYYAVDRFEGYGKLSKRSLEDMQAGARVEINERKRNPMDFALWKAAKPGEISWPSPWGAGRPGWHIECSAMSHKHLGERFDLHGGGRDLIFPHHENEIAQSEGLCGHQVVKYWLHNGFVNIDGEKMSKSLGNFFSIGDILDRYTPLTLRYFLATGRHYRGPIHFSDVLLEGAAGRVAYFYETLRNARAWLAEHAEQKHFTGPLPHGELAAQLVERFNQAMDDDFSVPRAMDPVHEAFRALNELISTRKAKAIPAAVTTARQIIEGLEQVDRVLNLFGQDPDSYLEGHRALAAQRHGLTPEWIAERLEARRAARTARLWAEADSIRDELLEKSVVIMDRASGQSDWSIEEKGEELEGEAEG